MVIEPCQNLTFPLRCQIVGSNNSGLLQKAALDRRATLGGSSTLRPAVVPAGQVMAGDYQRAIGGDGIDELLIAVVPRVCTDLSYASDNAKAPACSQLRARELPLPQVRSRPGSPSVLVVPCHSFHARQIPAVAGHVSASH